MAIMMAAVWHQSSPLIVTTMKAHQPPVPTMKSWNHHTSAAQPPSPITSICCADFFREPINLLNHTVEGESYQHATHNIRSCSNKLSELKIVYLNGRSILIKWGELVLMVQAKQPDIVSIVESWLDWDVDDSEINISGCQIFRADRNCLGGGVLVYIKNHLTGHLFQNHYPNLELLWLNICSGNYRLTLGTFYLPPVLRKKHFDHLCNSSQQLDPTRFNNLVRLGDFNVAFLSTHNSNH